MSFRIGPFSLPMETCTEGDRVTVIRRCQWCRAESRVTVDRDAYNRWTHDGVKVQDAFPELAPDVREQLMSGTHPACWKEMWKDDR